MNTLAEQLGITVDSHGWGLMDAISSFGRTQPLSMKLLPMIVGFQMHWIWLNIYQLLSEMTIQKSIIALIAIYKQSKERKKEIKGFKCN